jgi:hypothetical protein
LCLCDASPQTNSHTKTMSSEGEQKWWKFLERNEENKKSRKRCLFECPFVWALIKIAQTVAHGLPRPSSNLWRKIEVGLI